MSSQYKEQGVEPPLTEVFADPIIKLVMKSDGVSISSLLPMIEGACPKPNEQDAA